MKLNSTGSLSFSNGKYWSYRTKMTDTYNGYRLFNASPYSTTTSKHQAVIRREYDYDIVLTQCPFGDWDCKDALIDELSELGNMLKLRKKQRKTDKQKRDVAELERKIELINKALG